MTSPTTPDLREAVARLERLAHVSRPPALGSDDEWVGDYLNEGGYETDLYRILALATSAKVGWELVPAEPTPKMLQAAKPWLMQYGLMRAGDRENAIAQAFRAMITAAPPTEKEG